jgi:hypothetical protein
MHESDTEVESTTKTSSGSGTQPKTAGVKDVAQRDLDMGGFRIINMGEPKEEGEFARVDLKSTPKRSSGSGSAGKSLLAAPADHVHPAGEGGGAGTSSLEFLEESDWTHQMVTGTEEQVVAEFLVDFVNINHRKMAAGLEAIVKAESGEATFFLRLGGTPGEPDGKKILEFSTTTRSFEIEGKGVDDLDTPKEADIVKVTAACARRDGVAHIRAKKVRFSPFGDR